MGVVYSGAANGLPKLFVPGKQQSAPENMQNWLAVEQWANNLPPYPAAPTPLQHSPITLFRPGSLAVGEVIRANNMISPARIVGVDARLFTAPSSVSSSSCSNLTLAGLGSGGPIVIPFDVSGQNDYHVGIGGVTTNYGSLNNGLITSPSNTAQGGFFQRFKVSSTVVVESLLVGTCVQNDPYNYFSLPYPNVVIGLCSDISSSPTSYGTFSTDTDNMPWLTDTTGAPCNKAFPYDSIYNPSGNSSLAVPFAGSITLTPGTTYGVCAIIQDPNAFASSRLTIYPYLWFDLNTNVTGVVSLPGTGYTIYSMYYADGVTVFNNPGEPRPGGLSFALTGNELGTEIIGGLNAEITQTGTPSTPGSDMLALIQIA